MNPLEKRIDFVRAGMAVNRYHQRYTATQDTVGKHSAGVALWLVLMNDNPPRAELLIAALAHDLPECVVGDIPSPAKRALHPSALDELNAIEESLLYENGLHHDLTEDERRQLGLADALDGLMFCIEDRRRGNRDIVCVGDKYLEYLCAMPLIGAKEYAIRNILASYWKRLKYEQG